MYRHSVVQYNVPARCCTVQYTGRVLNSTMYRYGVVQYIVQALCCKLQCTGTVFYIRMYRNVFYSTMYGQGVLQ
jgi:hypothetical protein